MCIKGEFCGIGVVVAPQLAMLVTGVQFSYAALMDTNDKGDLALFKVILRASQKGYIISKPLNDSARYDLVIDVDGVLKKAQVKYGDGKSTNANGVIRVGLEKRYGNSTLVYTDKDVDLLLVYMPTTDTICAFSPDLFAGKKNLYIRYQPAKNKQSRNCIFAADYLW